MEKQKREMATIKDKIQREEKKTREKWMEEKEKDIKLQNLTLIINIRMRTIKALEPELQ